MIQQKAITERHEGKRVTHDFMSALLYFGRSLIICQWTKYLSHKRCRELKRQQCHSGEKEKNEKLEGMSVAQPTIVTKTSMEITRHQCYAYKHLKIYIQT